MTNVQADFTALQNNATAALSDNLRRNVVLLKEGMITKLPMQSEGLTRTIKVQGKLDAQALAEDTTATLQKTTETAVTLGIGKIVSVSRLTEESLQFGGMTATMQWFLDEQVAAIVEDMEEAVTGLAAGFSNEVVGTTDKPADIPGILAAALQIKLQTNNSSNYGNIKAVLSVQSAFEAIKASQVANNNSSILSNEKSSIATAVDAVPDMNGFIANVAGVNVYESLAIQENATDALNMVYDPRAIVGSYQDKVKVRADDDVLNWADVFGSCVFSGFTIYRQERAVRLPTAK